jgi:proteic killer suppression protein
MDIVFATAKLRKVFCGEKELRMGFGPVRARVIQRRMSQLAAAANLEVMRTIPGAHCHELKGSRKGQLAVDADYPKRIVFEPANEPIPAKPDGGIDWRGVTAIRIIEVVDYHGD